MKIITQNPAQVIPDVTEKTFESIPVYAVLTILEGGSIPKQYIAIARREQDKVIFLGAITSGNIPLCRWFGYSKSFIGLLINLWKYFPNDNPVVYIAESKNDLDDLLNMYNITNKFILSRLLSI